MPTLSLLEAAHELGPWESATVLRPEWKNPLASEGTGIELVTGRTLTELIATYRDKLSALIFIAQFAVLRCKKAHIEGLGQEEVLGKYRSSYDMSWHTDAIHRSDGSICVIVGESSIPTGLATKELIHQKLDDFLLCKNPNAALGAFNAHDDLWINRNGQAIHTLAEMQKGNKNNWLYTGEQTNEMARALDGINSDPSLLWYGKNPQELSDRDTAIFTTGLHLHCKKPICEDGKQRDGDKRRYQLPTERETRDRISEMLQTSDFGHLEAQSIDADWFKGLGK